jgi:acetoin utilization deacetylase AcuC-like enzyme
MSLRPLFVATHAAEGHRFPGHPECPDRVLAIEAALQQDADLRNHVTTITDIPLLGHDYLQAVHAEAYLADLRRRCAELAGPCALRDPDDPDGPTFATPTSYNDAVRAASTAAALVDRVVRAAGPAAALSACRPPGHHALADEFMGFCLINSIAVAARYAQNHRSLKKIAIVDIDVHVGNGTASIFDQDPSVLFIDIHREGVWPEATGSAEDVGSGAGKGATVHVPLPAGAGHAAAVRAMAEVVVPALRRFCPELIIVSAGFDAHYRDPLDCLQWQSGTYHALGAALAAAADELCGGRVVAVLEGGYALDVVGEAAAELARGLVGLPSAVTLAEEALPEEPEDEVVGVALQRVREIHGL